MMNEFLVDQKLKQEESRISKILESLCLKSNIQLDADGMPIPPPSLTSPPAAKRQTFRTPDIPSRSPYYTNDNDNENPPFSPLRISTLSATASPNKGQYSFERSSNNAYNQDLADLRSEMDETKKSFAATGETIKELEATVLQLFQWKTSMINFLLMTFHQYEQKLQNLISTTTDVSPTVASLSDQMNLPKPQDKSVAEKMLQEFHRMQTLIQSELFRGTTTTTITTPTKSDEDPNVPNTTAVVVKKRQLVLPKCLQKVFGSASNKTALLGNICMPPTTATTTHVAAETTTQVTVSCLVDYQPSLPICLPCQASYLQTTLSSASVHQVSSFHYSHEYYTLPPEQEEFLFQLFLAFATATTGLSADTATNTTTETTSSAKNKHHTKNEKPTIINGIKLGKQEIKWFLTKRLFLLFVWLLELSDNRKGISLQRIHTIFELACLHASTTNLAIRTRLSYEGFVYTLAILAIHHYAPNLNNTSSNNNNGKLDSSYTPYKHQSQITRYLTRYVKECILPKGRVYLQNRDLLWTRMYQYWTLTNDQIYLLLCQHESFLLTQYIRHCQYGLHNARAKTPTTITSRSRSNTPTKRTTTSTTATVNNTSANHQTVSLSPERRRFLTAMTTTTKFHVDYQAANQEVTAATTDITAMPRHHHSHSNNSNKQQVPSNTSNEPIVYQIPINDLSGLEIFCLNHDLLPSPLLPSMIIVRRISEYVQDMMFAGPAYAFTTAATAASMAMGNSSDEKKSQSQIRSRSVSPSPSTSASITSVAASVASSKVRPNTKNASPLPPSSSSLHRIFNNNNKSPSPNRSGSRSPTTIPKSISSSIKNNTNSNDASIASAGGETEAATTTGGVHNMYLFNCLFWIGQYIVREIAADVVLSTLTSHGITTAAINSATNAANTTTASNQNNSGNMSTLSSKSTTIKSQSKPTTPTPTATGTASSSTVKNDSNRLASIGTVSTSEKVYAHRKASPLIRSIDETSAIETRKKVSASGNGGGSNRESAKQALLLARKKKSLQALDNAHHKVPVSSSNNGNDNGEGERLYLPSIQEEERMISIIQYLIGSIHRKYLLDQEINK